PQAAARLAEGGERPGQAALRPRHPHRRRARGPAPRAQRRPGQHPRRPDPGPRGPAREAPGALSGPEAAGRAPCKRRIAVILRLQQARVRGMRVGEPLLGESERTPNWRSCMGDTCAAICTAGMAGRSRPR
ncbi:MAG: hypothetical protein ACK559_25350, partial [bacterium]